jgi:hypothetical protein
VCCAAAKPRVNAEKPCFFINTQKEYELWEQEKNNDSRCDITSSDWNWCFMEKICTQIITIGDLLFTHDFL